MMENEETKVYKKAVELWGRNAQSDMLIEECSELIKAIIKDRRGKVTLDEIIVELVDVQIMLNQMRIILDDESKWERWFSFKLDKLKTLIERDTKSKADYVTQSGLKVNKDRDMVREGYTYRDSIHGNYR